MPAVYSGRAMATLTETRKAALRRDLEAIVGPRGVLSERDELLVYESDGLTLFRALADFIVFPTSAEHVAAVVRLANREGIPFVARGAGTGLAGGCLPTEGGIVISMMRMNRVLEVDYDNHVAVVEPGLGNLHPNILYDPRKPGEEGRVVAAGAQIMKVCAEVGGSISGEHGIGLEKADFMPFIFSTADLDLMQRLKCAFNPTGLCNPGKVFPTKKSCVEVGPVV